MSVMVISSITASREAVRPSEPISETKAYEIFGRLPTEQNRGLSLTKIVSQAEKHHGQHFRVTTNISKFVSVKAAFLLLWREMFWHE